MHTLAQSTQWVGLTRNAAIELGQFGIRCELCCTLFGSKPLWLAPHLRWGKERFAKEQVVSYLRPRTLHKQFCNLGSDESRLEGKVALITGGAGGIGSRTAKLFSQNGAKVVIADLNEEIGQAVCKELGPQGATFIHCDVTKEDNVQNAVDATVSKYGKLDIMFNNAGIMELPKPSIVETEKSDFERVLSTNVIGVFLGTKHAARVMIPARRGSIINTSSIASIMGGITPHAYTSSKHAVVGLTTNAAIELGQFGVRVNCVAPHVVPTPMSTSLFKMGEEELAERVHSCSILKGISLKAEDIAEAALFLGSDESRYVNGHNLVVDGGYTVTNPTLIDALTS
ncbi:Short-chain dehydrogenase/reductase SDR [Cinnamomum micranthum f. kanehirae]|uniref:Short-chain dehydrogenase/reductase SDR n=1 Tax=Cinnamomum micranthum f. kanehirae TaxID=337451 RepID=A0A3S3MZ42_9MAGN|nr:Short-chain dehydrogenase/reductase SDR [Cinnamomum micranthum f. kanehirae]